MKKFLLLFISVLLLTGCSYKIVKVEQNQNLPTQTASHQQATNNLDSQVKCAELAKKYIDSNDLKDGNGITYTIQNHFNSKLNKCFILISAYNISDDFLGIDMYDVLENKRYATYMGHDVCDPNVLSATSEDLKKCKLDSGNIWVDGNDSIDPSFHFGFGGLNSGKIGDENTQKQFMEQLQPFMNN